MHPFDAAVALRATETDGFVGATSPAYANMVGPFGGVTSSLLLNAALSHSNCQGLPIALTVNFTAPINDGELAVLTRLVRANRSTQHWLIEAQQAGAVAALATAVFAERRATWSAPEVAAPPNLPAPQELQRLRMAGLPAWTQRYDMRVIAGGMPEGLDGQQQADSHSSFWVRDDPPRPMDFLSLAAVSDSFFPRIFLRRRRMMPVGTVSLTTYFHADRAMLAAQGEDYVLGVAHALAFRQGFFDQSAQIWSRAGELLASSHQIVYYKD
jgi:acyl-CoA thioesterase